MNRKILMPVMALLVLFVVAPVMAAPAAKIPYRADVILEIKSLDEDWTTKGGIQHVKGLIAEGTFNSTDLGIDIDDATMWKKLDYTLNTITGKGTMHGKFVLTVGEVGTFEGSFRDKITDFTHLSGTAVGQGTGVFEGQKTMGTWYGDIIDGTIENVLEAIILSRARAAPAIAIGPQKAEKNPNAAFVPWGVQLLLPSGVFNEWMADREGPMDRVHVLNASKFKIRNAFPLTDLADLLQLENKWVCMSQTVLVDLLMSFGYSRTEAEAVATMYPDGIYFRFVNVGK